MAQHKSDFYNDKRDNFYLPFYVELRRLNKNISDCSKLTLKEYENITIKQLREYENEYIYSKPKKKESKSCKSILFIYLFILEYNSLISF